MKILFIGDIIGEPGRRTVGRQVPRLVRERGVAWVIANAESAAGGFGVTPDVARELFAAGVHVLTSGNHIWDKKEVIDFIKDEPRLLRPANYPKGVPGLGRVVVTTAEGEKVGVVQVMGRVCMPTVDCPFRVVRHEVEAVKQEARTVIVDMHAEATSEKMAMGWYLDGEVTGVFGTHTHVQTADERILPKGTAYPTAGHAYFTLKDAASQMRAVLFRSVGRSLRFALQDGMQLVCRGRVTVYEPKGDYQVIVEYVEPKGVGALQLAFEQLKARLAAEGRFDQARKRPLPFFPRRIGVVTSATGAAIRDIVQVAHKRDPGITIVLNPVAVQGESAAGEIARAIEELNEMGGFDVLIVGRGRGSLEDLWAFNEELVARAIA